jgi:DNA-binding beta-propeller fold protein YncE
MRAQLFGRGAIVGVALAGLSACAPEDDDGAMGPGAATPVTVTPEIGVVLERNLTGPRDLAFNPRKPDQLWVVNRDGTVAIVDGATDPKTLKVEVRRDRNYLHFMPNPASLAFGADETNPDTPNPALAEGTFATCQESRNGGLDPRNPGNDFMGPVLWSSDLSVFALKNGELGSHLDMLHQSPLCMGIAWTGQGNAYFAFNGSARSIDFYDFQKDHGYGNDNHDDGVIRRYAAGQMSYVEGVPSHLVFSAEDGAVFAADTGNGRVVRLDYAMAKPGAPLAPKQDERESYSMTGERVTEVVPASANLVMRPSGIELWRGDLFVSDNVGGFILRLSRAGKLQKRYEVGAPAGYLAGMAFGPDDKLYFVDMVQKRVLRIDSAL